VSTVSTERRGATLVVYLSDPRTRNAMTQAMAEQVADAMDELDQSPDLRAAVITGTDGFFCAGQNLVDADAGRFARSVRRGWWGLEARPPRKPVVAAVDGVALGGGFEFALCCDLIVAGAETKFGLPETLRGMVALGGGLPRLPRRIPYHLAVKMALTGDPVSAVDLERHGLVAAIAESGPALEKALELVAGFTRNPAIAVETTIDILRMAGQVDLASASRYQDSIANIDLMRHTDVYIEGVRSFKEKRPPAWAV
jgi:enoyl-CoA hydratase